MSNIYRLLAGLIVFFSINAWAELTYVPNEIIIKLKKADPSLSHINDLQASFSSLVDQNVVEAVEPLETDPQIVKLTLSNEEMMSSMLTRLEDHPDVEIAEPNFIYSIDAAAPNDGRFQEQWGMNNTAQGDGRGGKGIAGAHINMLPVWGAGHQGNKDIVVAVIDTGIDWTHPDLVDNLYTNPGEAGAKATNGIDDDGNGFVDDTHGWNFFAKNRNSSDDHNHGTHCAGIIGAKGNNSLGVAGVVWNVRMMPIKFLSAKGRGNMDAALNSINYAVKMGVDVMSNSWGGPNYSKILEAAIRNAEKEGIVFVAAAGNAMSNNDITPTYPATYQLSNVISVAATSADDTRAGFSNYGAKTVHVAAPGNWILSTVREAKYASYRGTSMACPHVAGMAALMKSIAPNMTPAEIRERLVKTSDPVKALRHQVIARGRVNAFNMLNNIVPPSNEPDPKLWKDVPMVIESAHPYENRKEAVFKVSHPGAKFIRVHFEKIEIEKPYDKLFVESGGRSIEALSGNFSDYTSDYFEGSQLQIRLRADKTVNKWGFKIDKIQVIE